MKKMLLPLSLMLCLATLSFVSPILAQQTPPENQILFDQPEHGTMKVIAFIGDEMVEYKSGDIVKVPPSTGLLVSVAPDADYEVKRIYTGGLGTPETDLEFYPEKEGESSVCAVFLWVGSTRVTAEIVKTDATAEVAPARPQITVHPNPAFEALTIAIAPSLIGEKVCIFNTVGERVICKQAAAETFRIERGMLPCGTYILRVGSAISRFILR